MKPYLFAAVSGLCLSWGILSVQTSLSACEDGCYERIAWFNDAIDNDECIVFDDNQARIGWVPTDIGTQKPTGLEVARKMCPKDECSYDCNTIKAGTWNPGSPPADDSNCRNIENNSQFGCYQGMS